MQEHKNKSNKWQTIEAIIIDIIVASIIVIAIIITTKILFGKQIKKAIEVVDMVSINSENSIIPEIKFDEKNNTMICSNCHGKVSEKNIIDNSTIYALQYIVTSPITRLFSFDVTDKVLEQMKGIINKYIKKHIDRKFNSLEFLEI